MENANGRDNEPRSIPIACAYNEPVTRSRIPLLRKGREEREKQREQERKRKRGGGGGGEESEKGGERERELRAIAATLMAEEQIGRNKHGTTSSVGSPLCDEVEHGAKSLRMDQAPGTLHHDGERRSERANERA